MSPIWKFRRSEDFWSEKLDHFVVAVNVDWLRNQFDDEVEADTDVEHIPDMDIEMDENMQKDDSVHDDTECFGKSQLVGKEV